MIMDKNWVVKNAKIAEENTYNAIKASIKQLSHWFICPFDVISGVIGSTETGYKPINAIANDYGRFSLIFTGLEAVIARWINSTFHKQLNKGIKQPDGTYVGQDQKYTRIQKVGLYWKGQYLQDESEAQFSNLIGKTAFKTLESNRKYTMILSEPSITREMQYKFYVILNDNNGDPLAQTNQVSDRQWLYVSSCVNYFSPLTNKFVFQVVIFSSVNDVIESSGLSTSQFIQPAGPGDGYAFPIVVNHQLRLNEELLRPVGVKFAHLQTYTLGGIGSVRFMGRPIIQGKGPKKYLMVLIFPIFIHHGHYLLLVRTNKLTRWKLTGEFDQE